MMKVVQVYAETQEINLKVSVSDHAHLVKGCAFPTGEYSCLLLFTG